MRYRNKHSLILECLDRFLANDQRIQLYPEATVHYLPRTHFDYSLMLLQFYRAHQNILKPFRVESMWCGHANFRNLVDCSFPEESDLTIATLAFENHTKIWNREVFGNIFHRKKHVLARLEGIKKSPNYPNSTFLHDLESNLLRDFNYILDQEYEFWKLKPRIN